MPHPEDLVNRLAKSDPYLEPYRNVIRRRLALIEETSRRLTGGKKTLADVACGHEYFGLHFRNDEWVFREWAPHATGICLIGDMSEWKEKEAFALSRIGRHGVWEIRLPADALAHGDHYRLRMHWSGGSGDRLPAYGRRMIQDPETLIFNAQVWLPPSPYRWQYPNFKCSVGSPLIYETHVGMAQQEEKIGSYQEFTDNIIPKIKQAGYNTIQLMAVQEHPYYGSFGYQVSNLFAASSRFGPPEDLKRLIDTAHGAGIAVIMDLVHSHAVSNEVEGLSRFDGTRYQYFHDGPRGIHRAWDSRCFDYGKPEVLHFLLSNCRFWLDEYCFDGFRFDGVTSMLYLHHGLETAFTGYDNYFDDSVDEDALAYLALANRMIHDIRPDAMTIAEDVSGLPGLAVGPAKGGIGFDYRFAMGVPDFWIRLIKEFPDEAWPLGLLWFELTNRRADEKTISYAESHDQALVGDQTIVFRLIGADMYDHMQVEDENVRVDRGMALHKMIRLITLATSDSGYLNFMGNEFGHPEWIDFPREGNNWSLRYARRQWHLLDDTSLKYKFLGRFDRDMLALVKKWSLFDSTPPSLLYEQAGDKIIVFERAGCIFAFNFHPHNSYPDYRFAVAPGVYRIILDSDAAIYGGHGRIDPQQIYEALGPGDGSVQPPKISLYLPSRTALVLRHKNEE